MATRNYGSYMLIDRQKKQGFGVKAERTYHITSHSPSTISAGETLYVRIPKLGKNTLIIPNTLKLSFSISLSGHKDNYVVNNLGRNIIIKKVTKIGGEIVREINNCHLYDTYKDLWKTSKERINMAFQGIQSVNLRKLRSKASDANKNVAQDNFMAEVYQNMYMIPLDFEVNTDHLPFYPYAIPADFTEELTFSLPNNVIVSSDTTGWGYNINYIALEYETIIDEALANQVTDRYMNGISFLYEYVTHFKTEETRDATIINTNINIPKRSLKGILILFESKFTEGTRDSEKFSNPSITNVDITMEGLPNKVYSQGYKANKQWYECRKFFYPSEEHKHNDNLDMDEPKFYGDDKFALWVDLRSTEDVSLHGSGLRLQNTKDGVQLSIKRDSTENYKMYVYVVADAQLNLVGIALRDVLH
jgi:hypothetical protein